MHRVPGSGFRRRVEIRCNERLSSFVSSRPHAQNPVKAVGVADDVVVTRFSTFVPFNFFRRLPSGSY